MTYSPMCLADSVNTKLAGVSPLKNWLLYVLLVISLTYQGLTLRGHSFVEKHG